MRGDPVDPGMREGAPTTHRPRQGPGEECRHMPCCCAYHAYSWPQWGWTGPYPPYPGRYAEPLQELYTRRLEEERDMLERRLRRLEQELEELRRGARHEQERV